MHDVLDPVDVVPDELDQLLSSGYTVPDDLVRAIRHAARRADRRTLVDLAADLATRVVRNGEWDGVEPSEPDRILAALDDPFLGDAGVADREVLRDRILGGWLGRCVGCCIGKPVEGLTPEQTETYLRAGDSWPVTGFVPLVEPLPAGITELHPSASVSSAGTITECPRDDDLDYTVLGLHILETHGTGFTPADVVREWLDRLPFTQTYTAERIVYRNVVRGVPVEQAAEVDNPYREWIGALIRADIFGYVSPGRPADAVRLALRDARVSHRANGVYGAMWAAALVASAFTAPDAAVALERAASWIPPRSRLRGAVDRVREMHDAGASWAETIADIRASLGHYPWVHTINNAAVISAGLLWGGGDLARSVGLTVQAGWDTDSNGATVGSVVGVLCGARRLPIDLVAPFHDTLRSAVREHDRSRISRLADRTTDLALSSQFAGVLRGTTAPSSHPSERGSR